MYRDDEIIDKVLVSIRRIVRAIDLHSRKLIQSCGLTIPQIIVLRDILRSDSPTVGEIARSVSLSQATVTNIIARLEQRGFMVRSQHEGDKRRVVVRLTEAGRKTIDEAPPLLHDRFVSSFQNLQEWERLMILSSIQRVGEMMEAEELEAAPLLSPGAEIFSNEPPLVKAEHSYSDQ